jgi:uncharacterized repeat protein (TIGR03803 family)
VPAVISRTIAVVICASIVASPLAAATFETIYRFRQQDGIGPLSLAIGDNGTLVGAATSGGIDDKGTVFMLSPPPASPGLWTMKRLHAFAGWPTDGRRPLTGLTRRGKSFYGTTFQGGVGEHMDAGTVFRVTPPVTGDRWTYEILYTFKDDGKGYGPDTPLAIDSAGHVYGLTIDRSGNDGHPAGGVLYKLTPVHKGEWPAAVVYRFSRAGSSDGSPGVFGGAASLAIDSSGAVVTTSWSGGSDNRGTVFRVMPGPDNAGGSLEVLHNFTGSEDNQSPTSGVLAQPNGALYGAIRSVYRLTPPVHPSTQWNFSVLATFGGDASLGPLVLDRNGGFVGSSTTGGDFGHGFVYRLTPGARKTSWTVTVLHHFTGGGDGKRPIALTVGNDKTIYGVTYEGGRPCNCGTAFMIKD